MKINFCRLFTVSLFFLILTFPVQSEDIPTRINFGKSAVYGKFITSRELSVWGSSRNLSLIGDCSFQDMDDFEAEVIPVQGMDFVLSAPGKGRVYLYLDLVSFVPSSRYDLQTEDNYCYPDSEKSVYKDDPVILPGMRWLEILVNGKSLKTVYTGNGIFLNTPIVVIVDREYAFRRTLKVTLKPSPGETFFGIWDAFAVKERLVKNND